MVLRLFMVGLCVALGGSARAASFRVSAEAPLSGDRLGDALRSYLDNAEVAVATAPAEDGGPLPPEAGVVAVFLRKSHSLSEDASVIVVEGEETVVARLPGVLRTEDLYRAAALKVQALLQRRASPAMLGGLAGTVGATPSLAAQPVRDVLALDVGLAWLVPSTGVGRPGLRLGIGRRLGYRWAVGLGGYIEPSESANNQGIAISTWELPFELSLGVALYQRAWRGWLQGIGQMALRRFAAQGTGVVSATDTTLAPRAGGALAFAVGPWSGLSFQARVALLAALVDTRYRVDGQVVWPAAGTLLLAELGLSFGGR